ncbi:MAG: TetR family transcriptional regulator [Moraxellaceae bacterium]|nr:MAG: TetR family transcriptional regulator [Moraxellaceae bacterium]
MKTRDRILLTSLELFNLCGEPNVTTIDIANEMDISPGNLYYHFRNKDEIIFELFLLFESTISEVLDTPQTIDLDMVDYWMYIHMIFERIWEYRFYYRDLVSILERNEKLQKRFNRVIDKKTQTCKNILSSMSESETISVHDHEIESIATNMVITTTYWLNYLQLRNIGKQLPEEDLGKGVYQVMSLVVPYLSPEYKDALEEVAASYLS